MSDRENMARDAALETLTAIATTQSNALETRIAAAKAILETTQSTYTDETAVQVIG